MASFSKRRFLRSSVLTVGLAALAGCSMFSSGGGRHEPAPLTEYPAGISAAITWTVSVGSGSGVGFAPTVVGDAVYAATPNGGVVKASLSSGTVQWRTSAGRELSAGVGSDGMTTVVAAPDGTLIAYDDQGKEKWSAKASSQVDIPPAVGGGIVAVRSSDYRIQAFDAETGHALWNIQRPGPALALKTTMRLLIIEGLVISGLPNGKLIAIAADSGAVQWEGTVSVSRGATDLERISDVVGLPQTQGPYLCGAAYQGSIVCFDVAQGGLPIWEQPFSTATGLGSDEQQVYAANQRDVVHAFRLSDGEPSWTQDALRNRKLTSPAVLPHALALGDFQGYVHFLSRVDGQLLGRIQLGGGAIVSPPIATSHGVVVQTGNGNLVLVGVN